MPVLIFVFVKGHIGNPHRCITGELAHQVIAPGQEQNMLVVTGMQARISPCDGGLSDAADPAEGNRVLGTGEFNHSGDADEILDQNEVNNRRRSRTCIPTKNGLKP